MSRLNNFATQDAWFYTNDPKIDSSEQTIVGERTGLVVRASDSGSGDPGLILGRVGVLFP